MKQLDEKKHLNKQKENDQDSYIPETIDEPDLYEEFDNEELYEIVKREQKEANQRANVKKDSNKPRTPFPRWAFWLIALAMLINVIAILPQTYSIPAIDFLKKSAELSKNSEIDVYQDSVVVIQSQSSKGTGFSISKDGYILTNHHVIEDKLTITVAYPNQGLYSGEVVAEYPSFDLAVVKVDGKDLPHLTLAKNPEIKSGDHVYFIGNPLQFNGIANEGEIIGYDASVALEKPALMLDAPIYHGNSGSPVINEQGEVIAVVYATKRHGDHGKVGLSIPITYFHELNTKNY